MGLFDMFKKKSEPAAPAGPAPVSAQETYEQAAIQFDDQVDVVFQLEPVDQQPAKTPAAQ